VWRNKEFIIRTSASVNNVSDNYQLSYILIGQQFIYISGLKQFKILLQNYMAITNNVSIMLINVFTVRDFLSLTILLKSLNTSNCLA
jgi:hypothetical protein